MNWGHIALVFRKEMLDLGRDRKTLLFMVLLPIVVIPGLRWVMNQFVETGVKRLTEDTSTIAVIGGENGAGLVDLIDALAEFDGGPASLAGIDDPLLAQGLQNIVTGDEFVDAMLTAGALEEMEEEQKDRLGSARFLQTVPFAPRDPELAEWFEDGTPEFLADAQRLRLIASARTLRGLESTEPADLLRRGPELLADQKRLEMLDSAGQAQVDLEVAALDRLALEIGEAAEAGDYHALFVLHRGFDEALQQDGTARYTLLFDDTRDRSAAARRKLGRFLDKLDTGVVRARVVGHALERSVLDPFRGAELDLGRGRNILANFLPYVVLMMCFLGAIYPAIDLGAGEKERGTLETLLVTPASRLDFVVGKFLMITVSAAIASLLNVLSLVGSAKLGLLASSDVLGSIAFDPLAVVVSMVLMLPVAALFASVLLAVSIYAKSFKEAQSYSTPINFAILIPAFASFIPGVELTRSLALAPLVSVSLALKEAWSGIFQWDCLAIILVSSAIYAALALAFCTRWFQREEVLFRT